ncbi:hypothetical protein PATSB16_13560 [Pandoraea thiooxydans]|nr:hypothetical protein PATSB16_13560 [Pandoraea thiooxydans]
MTDERGFVCMPIPDVWRLEKIRCTRSSVVRVSPDSCAAHRSGAPGVRCDGACARAFDTESDGWRERN